MSNPVFDSEGWCWDMEAAPKNDIVLVADIFGVQVSQRCEPDTFETWWDIVGGENEEPDRVGYQQYLDEAAFGFVSYDPETGDEEYLDPVAWRPLPPRPSSLTSRRSGADQ